MTAAGPVIIGGTKPVPTKTTALADGLTSAGRYCSPVLLPFKVEAFPFAIGVRGAIPTD